MDFWSSVLLPCVNNLCSLEMDYSSHFIDDGLKAAEKVDYRPAKTRMEDKTNQCLPLPSKLAPLVTLSYSFPALPTPSVLANTARHIFSKNKEGHTVLA